MTTQLTPRTEVDGADSLASQSAADASPSSRAVIFWPLITALATFIAACIPPLFFARYYWVGDTEAGAFGQWYKIGERLLAGDWSVLNPTVWQSGVYLADGAWGIYSPILWVLGLFSHVFDDTLLAVNIVKIFFSIVGALGVYWLAREYRVVPAIAATIGVAAPLAGLTQYQDATSWATGQIAWAILPFAWAALLRVVRRGSGILPPVIFGFLILGISYTHATLMLGLAVASVMVEALVRRHRPEVVRLVWAGLILALGVLIVHLPAVLTVGDTERQAGVFNNGNYVASLSGMVQMLMPLHSSKMLSTAGNIIELPFMYITWMVPFLAFVQWRDFVHRMRTNVSLLVFLAVTFIAVQLPSDVGPLRWPARLYPYFAVAILIALGVAFTFARVRQPGRFRLVFALALVCFSGFISLAAGMKFGKAVIAFTVVLCIVYLVIYLWMTTSNHALRRHLTVTTGSALAIGLSVGIVLPQHYFAPEPITTNHHMPTSLSVYQHMLDGSQGDILAIGDTRLANDPAKIAHEAAIGNAWYLTALPVQNAYTTLEFAGYKQLLCMGVKGVPCADAFERLFLELDDTGLRAVDALGVSSILLQKPSFNDDGWETLPAGWSIVHDTDQTRLIVRDHPIPGAGGIVQSSPGMTLTHLQFSAQTVEFTVEEGSPSGSVVLSRLPWSGYEVSGAELGDATAGFLLTVDVAASDSDTRVVVSYRPPGQMIMMAAAVGIGISILLWVGLRLFARATGQLEWLSSSKHGFARR